MGPAGPRRDDSARWLVACPVSAWLCRISFRVPADGPVDLALFDLGGHRAASLPGGPVRGGRKRRPGYLGEGGESAPADTPGNGPEFHRRISRQRSRVKSGPVTTRSIEA